MDGSMWPPRFEEQREQPPAFLGSSRTGTLIAISVSSATLVATAVLLAVLALYGGNHSGALVA